MVAPLEVMLVAFTAEITGAVVSEVSVVNVEAVDVLKFPAGSRDNT